VSVVEDAYRAPVTLVADDYELSWTGQTLRRLNDGTTPRWYWYGRVKVTYTPVDDLAQRQRAQLALMRLDITTNPGLASQTIGTWSESYRTDIPASQQRVDILASLGVDGVGIY
jgi:hypothetical protein